MRQAAAVALIMSLLIGAAVADVYRSVDAQGHVQYSDTPTPGAELVHMQKFGVAGATTSSSAPPASSSASTVRRFRYSASLVICEGRTPDGLRISIFTPAVGQRLLR